MSVPKIKGIENEWAIVTRTGHNYESTSIFHFEQMVNLIRQYFSLSTLSLNESLKEIENADRIRESGFRGRARFFGGNSSQHNLLPNGARFYIDGSHLEYSTPECLSARTLAAADRAGEVILNLTRKKLNESLAEKGTQIFIYKDNSDRNGHSYGCHENYLVSREAFNRIIIFDSIATRYLASFLVGRLMFTGSGKIGAEINGRRIQGLESIYQISQRADFVKTLLSGDTLDNRAIINSRDEPLADRLRFGRLHIIIGDANMSEIASYMKVGITSIILKMIEDDFLGEDIIIKDPVKEIKLASRDLTCKEPVLETSDGRKLSLLNLNEEFFKKIKDYFSKVSEPSAEEIDLVQRYEEIINCFQTGNEARLRRIIDWKIKQGILNDFLGFNGISWKDVDKARIRSGGKIHKVADHLLRKDLLYHNINKEEGLYWLLKEASDVDELVSKEEVANFIKNPPEECRSYFRGRCLSKFSKDIESVDWDHIAFKRKASETINSNFYINYIPPLVEMLNPAWGGRRDVGEILDRADDYQGLLDELKKIHDSGGE